MKIISPFSLFLLLYMSFIALFGTIYRSYCTILINFYFLFTVILTIIFQFQKNKLYLNTL